MALSRFKHFEIERLLGRGGMGEVYLAHDANLERRVALKLLPRELLRDPSAQGRLLDEARSISRVQHPNIAVIHSIEEDGGVYALCMEYIEGLSLKELLHRKGPLPLRQILHVAAQVAAGMQAAHEAGIVHRDLKPANVMVTTGGEAKVMDFGLALRPQRVVDTVGSSTYGTVQYMSPEQARGENLDARSDIFSFGSTLYELTTGQAPFQGPNDLAILQAILNAEPPRLRDVRREVPPALEQFIRGCMAKPVGARWESMASVRDELKYLTPVANAGPRDLINELSTNLSEKERDEEHKPRNHGTVGRRPEHLTPPAGAQSGPTPRVHPEEAMDFADALPEGVVIHEIVDRGIVEQDPSAESAAGTGASAGLDIQTTSEQWQEIASRSRRIDLIRREVAAREAARARADRNSEGSQEGLDEILAWTSDSHAPTTLPPDSSLSSQLGEIDREVTSSTSSTRPAGADPFVGPDPTRSQRRVSNSAPSSRDSKWKMLVPMLLAILLAAAGAWAILRTAGLELGASSDESTVKSPPAEANPGSVVRAPQPVRRAPTQTATSDSLARAELSILGSPLEMPLVPLPRQPRPGVLDAATSEMIGPERGSEPPRPE